MRTLPRQTHYWFFALNICQIKIGNAYAKQAKKLPRDVSAVRLGRLARAIWI